MHFFPSPKVFLEIGGLSIAWYAVLILTGAFIAYAISAHNLKKLHYPKEFAEDLFIDVLIVGIIGARLWFCVFYDLPYYLSHPTQIIAVWNGGLAIQGGLIAGATYAYFYVKKRGISFLRAADAIVPNILIAQAIGRWGNFVNQEAHGGIVDESFFDGILGFLKNGMYINGEYYLPTFFFESVLCIVGFILIVFVLKRFQNKRGDLMWAYMMWYGLIRFFIEGQRTDSLMFGPLRMAQLTSIAFIIIGLLGFIGVIDKAFKKKKPTILFDLDGTLVDTEKGIHEAYRYVLKNHGREDLYTEEFKTEVLGPSLKSIFSKYLPELNSDELVAEYRKYNNEIFGEVNSTMKNAEMVLKSLKEAGYDVGVVSTKMNDTVVNNLDFFNLSQYVGDVVGSDDVKNDKPDPEGINLILKRNRWYRDELIYVGDSTTDIKAGKAAGAYTIGFLFNENKKEAVKAAGANAYIEDLADILKIVEEDHHFTAELN